MLRVPESLAARQSAVSIQKLVEQGWGCASVAMVRLFERGQGGYMIAGRGGG